MDRRRRHHHHRIHTARSTDLNTDIGMDVVCADMVCLAQGVGLVGLRGVGDVGDGSVQVRALLNCSSFRTSFGRPVAAPFDITISKTPPKQTLTERLDCIDDERRWPRSRWMR